MTKNEIDEKVNKFETPEMRAEVRRLLEQESAEKKAKPQYTAETWKNEFGFFKLSELTAEEKQPPEFIVDGMIPCGMTFLSGAPKLRKSFLALQMCFAVANGTDFLGHPTKQCDCLYFDLEGSKSRASARAERMTLDTPDNVLIANKLKHKITNTGERSLVDDLAEIINYQPSIRMIILDTYSRARGRVQTGGSNSYDCDVELLEQYQRFSIENKIALVFVHHDRKGAGLMADSFERLSGTMGISGSADSVLNLVADGKRFEGRANLEYNPRDARGGEMKLFFDELSCTWRVDDAPQSSIADIPLAQFCIDHVPDKGMQADFFTYETAFKGIYGYPGNEPGRQLAEDAKRIQSELFTNYGIALQISVHSKTGRGFRLMKI